MERAVKVTSPNTGRFRSPDASLEEAFRKRFRRGQPDECWPWIGTIDSGYGVLKRHGKRFKAHRVSYMLARGPIPPGMLVCHHCDNPPCVNPKHLFLGTVKDNAEDAVKKGRYRRGDKHPSSKLTEVQRTEIRSIYRRRSRGQFSVQGLADRYRVCFNTIWNVLQAK